MAMTPDEITVAVAIIRAVIGCVLLVVACNGSIGRALALMIGLEVLNMG